MNAANQDFTRPFGKPSLMNGHAEIRVRSSDSCIVLPCGCAHTATEWVQLCGRDAAGHFEEWQQRHDTAAVDHTYNIGG